MLLNCCYCPYIRTILKYVHHFANIAKLKYNILGLRFIQSPDGGLIIQSPKELPGAFTQVKKEKFSWKICNDDIQ